MVTSGYERITAPDGGAFGAHRVLPERGHGPGVILLREAVASEDPPPEAERLAGHGFVVLVPEVFRRARHRLDSTGEPGPAENPPLARRHEVDGAVTDMAAALARLRAMPECTGRVGGVGFGLGGSLAYLLATSVRVEGRGPDAVVSYYGSAVPDLLDRVEGIECPVMFHVGDRDPFLSTESAAAVEAAVANRPEVTVHHYDAGHAFADADTSSHDPESAELAWGRTVTFLDDFLH
ncbi:dienelactone hydrolase family protein [Saccharomonospora saliphila]|uniref:dienelactone hydrolase family protein n=1 Tax=Saccharomonospora saliphila TaxID=369829 RepID=UPI00037CBA7E|nr:dienelactone hydrolase family protein [Saccharomonospora saliphila]